MSDQQQRHVPLNSDSELESFVPAPARGDAASGTAAHVPLNSASESEYEPQQQQQQPSVAFDDDAVRGRGRGGGFAAQTGAFAEPNSGDDDDTLPPLSDARARSRTPRGARSKSRSRSRARAEGGLRTDVMMNSASEESSGPGISDDDRVGRPAAGYVPQNDGSGAFFSLSLSSAALSLDGQAIPVAGCCETGESRRERWTKWALTPPYLSLAPPPFAAADTDADGSAPSSRHINTTYSGQKARSRSRSQNRAVKYNVPLNSESESDEVATEYTTGPPSADFRRLDRIDHPLNSESERE